MLTSSRGNAIHVARSGAHARHGAKAASIKSRIDSPRAALRRRRPRVGASRAGRPRLLVGRRVAEFVVDLDDYRNGQSQRVDVGREVFVFTVAVCL